MSKKSSASGNDSKFFQTTRKGETHELKLELNAPEKNKKKDAVKKVIANMTVGKDVSMLFADVVNCMQTGNIELKKLVYLYLINYAKSNPDLAILAVNTFVKDANDPNPLIRALAVRTMGCIRVDRITEYLCEPLRRCLKDEDPYVRKTAAVCVAKLYDISPSMVEDQGFLEVLQELISDSNPTVVANAVAALHEISENSGEAVFEVTTSVLQKLLAALNECTEWGQVFILDSLARYTPADAREAEGIIERVTPRLQHANSAVVMSAVKVIMRYLERITSSDTLRALSRKLAPPLVTLLSTEPEIQYVALRNINLIVQKRPYILAHEIKVFFCKYNDPIYVKMEKLEIIIRLVDDRKIEQVLLELKEYATEVDVDFVRKSVRAIGRCAIKLERAAERCINVLLDLIQTKVNYVVQEAVVVIKDIFRKYPDRYESIIATLCENLDTLDEPEAKGSMVWIIGEYAERIDNADELLETFLDTFDDETALVQLQLLTATVKLFLKKPESTQEMVQRVLNMATEDSDNPDLRDRGYVYWRLLSTNPEAAKAVVLAEKPVIADDTSALDPALLNQLIDNIASLSSIYHKPPEAFVVRTGGDRGEDEEDAEFSDDEDEEGGGAAAVAAAAAGIDLLDMGMGGGDAAPPAAASPASFPTLLEAGPGKGMQVAGSFVREAGAMVFKMHVTNVACAAPITQVLVQFNKSSFGFFPTNNTLSFNPPLAPGASGSQALPITLQPNMVAQGAAPSTNLQAALKNAATGDVVYIQQVAVDFTVLLNEGGPMEKGAFLEHWRQLPEANEKQYELGAVGSTDAETCKAKLAARNIFWLTSRDVAGATKAYFSCSVQPSNAPLLCEITFTPGAPGLRLCVKTQQVVLADMFHAGVVNALA